MSESSTPQALGVAESPPAATCWCGGSLGPSPHPDYFGCLRCGTQVAREIPGAETLRDHYRLDPYWRDQAQRLDMPPIEVRARNDFGDRIPVWYRFLRRYQPACRSLLEIGCSHGGFLAYCRSHGIPEVVGVEVSPETCAFARERFGLPEVHPGLFPEVDLPRPSYDVIAAFDLFEHLSAPLSSAQAMLEHLAPGGALLLQLPCYRGEGRDWPMFLARDRLYLYTSDAIREILERAGFEVTAVTKAIFWYDQFVVARRAGEVTPGQRWRDRLMAFLPQRRKATRAERHAARNTR